MRDEEWRSVIGWDGRYDVSDHGRVRNSKGLIKALYPHPRSGHLQVDLGSRVRGDVKRCKVHHLVLEAFVGPRGAGLLGLHWDDDPTNNTPSNLRWGTHSDNRHDSVRNGTHFEASKTRCSNGHEYTEENTRRYKNGTRRCYTCQRAQWASRKVSV